MDMVFKAVMAVVGSINPTGNEHDDAIKVENLEKLITLTDMFVSEIIKQSQRIDIYHDSVANSVDISSKALQQIVYKINKGE